MTTHTERADFREGDRVVYRPVGGAMQTTIGVIKKVLTEPKPAGNRGNVAKASEDEPRYVIFNEHTGKETPYKRENIIEKATD